MRFEKAEQYSLRALLAVSDIFLFIFSFLTGELIFFFLAVFLCVFMILLYVYVSLACRHLYYIRDHSSSAVEGEEFYVHAAVANFSYLPIFCLRVEDSFGPGRSFSIDRSIRETLSPRSVYEYTCRTMVSRKMGTYRVGPARLIVSDPFGVFSKVKEAEYFTDLTVYPAIRVADRFRLMELPVLTRLGVEIVHYAGSSIDFRGQREYRREDSKRVIHWRATARKGELIVKEFDEKGITDIGIYVDCRAAALRGTGNVTTHELALNAAASICAAASIRHHRFSVSFVGHDENTSVPPGAGHYHLHAVLQAMVQLKRPGKYSSFVSGAQAVLNTVHRNGSAVFIFNQTVTDASEMSTLIRKCVSMGIKPVLILIDDRTFLKLYPEQLEHDRTAPHVIHARELFQSAGAEVFILSKNDIPAEVLNTQSLDEVMNTEHGRRAV